MKTSCSLVPLSLLSLSVLAFGILMLFAPTAQANPGIKYVKTTGAASGTCTGWANACTLAHALSIAGSGDEIWVASGTYLPTTEGLSNPRTASFTLTVGVALYGGFAGTETLRTQRNITAYTTTLSGNIGDPNVSTDNAYHVVSAGSGIAQTAVLDGFSITGGNADTGAVSPDPYNYGGGMYVGSGSPTVANVSFSSNRALWRGGGMYVESGSPALTNVTFSANVSTHFGGGMHVESASPTLSNVTFSGNWADVGSGIYNSNGSLTLANATFSGNSAGGSGGGMYNASGSLTLTNVTFGDNHALFGHGGGLYNGSGNPALTDVTFSGNSAGSAYYGGGLYNGSGNPALTNVTFSGNSAVAGGGIYNSSGIPALRNVTLSGNSARFGGGLNNGNASVTIYNTIFWGNTILAGGGGPEIAGITPIVGDSIVEGGYPGSDIDGIDPHLGTLGNNGGTTQTFPLPFGSPAIDAGNNGTCAPTDQRGITRPQGSRCDMGAYEARFTLAKIGGDNQSTLIRSSFALPLQTTFAETGSGPVAGMVITYTAPSSGASATWSGNTIITRTTDASGITVVPAPTANHTVGSYVVTANAPNGSPSASFTLTNNPFKLRLPFVAR